MSQTSITDYLKQMDGENRHFVLHSKPYKTVRKSPQVFQALLEAFFNTINKKQGKKLNLKSLGCLPQNIVKVQDLTHLCA